MLTPAKSVMHITQYLPSGPQESLKIWVGKFEIQHLLKRDFASIPAKIQIRCNCPLAPTVPTALALRNIPKGSFMQSVLHSYIPLNSMMGIGYTYVWKNKRMGKEGVPGCRPSVVAAAAAARHIAPHAEALAGGGRLRLAIHPCDFLSWLPASAVPTSCCCCTAAVSRTF